MQIHALSKEEMSQTLHEIADFVSTNRDFLLNLGQTIQVSDLPILNRRNLLKIHLDDIEIKLTQQADSAVTHENVDVYRKIKSVYQGDCKKLLEIVKNECTKHESSTEIQVDGVENPHAKHSEVNM